MKTITAFFFLIFLLSTSYSQNYDNNITAIQNQITSLDNKKDSLYTVLEDIKLQKLRADLEKYGLPELLQGEQIIKHSAMYLVYSEEHEQAKWVAHIISTDVATGRLGRTNDFRPDSLVPTGSAVEADYFLKYLQTDGSYTYDGFGFDRGHLAPSADFRWSKKAISESYLYSNMSPQRGSFNRGGWATLENLMRSYVIEKNTALMVVTGPVLNDSLDVVFKGVNQVSIPEYYFKVAYDTMNNIGIGFIMPNKEIVNPIESYAVTIDEVEKLTGINFFASLPDNIENDMERNIDVTWWLPASQQGDVLPMNPDDLPHNYFNTLQAKQLVNSGTKVRICGTVVSTFRSRKGNIFINLDKQYPNQVFTITIFASNLINFSYEPEVYLKGKQVCVRGKISEFNGTPSMIIDDENDIDLYQKRR